MTAAGLQLLALFSRWLAAGLSLFLSQLLLKGHYCRLQEHQDSSKNSS
jgi:hypothetical protein